MSKLPIIVAALVCIASRVTAHGGVTTIGIAGKNYTGWLLFYLFPGLQTNIVLRRWQPYNSPTGQVTAERPYSSFNPILDPVDPTMHCNDDGTAGPSQQTLTIAAGQTITSFYTQWTHAEGPYTVYLAQCPSSDCTSLNTASAKWFKIYELGLITGTVGKGSWANGLLMKNLKWDTVIPANLQAGNYMIRWETLALHQANTPQFYPECAQLQVTGGGSVFPTSDYLVSIPGAWKASDPGVTIDIYSTAAQAETTYQIPGPRVYPGFGGSSTLPSNPVTTSSPEPTYSITTKGITVTSASVAPTTSAPSTGGAAHYAQCGGTGWNGATSCTSPYTCTKINDYYYQCL
ncbi:glycoside hydrolase family 61 protein [Ceratobasidium sp. AG-Ba]|nr:glycoside hydrolase family 61 protein [Ceratobasidium sp. AG-Ba]